jgi:diaminohydroxyphosphoribosylaminopyrimidine deaminase/5-amino-6-(5-phosphoribosylamino)uracil reductase
MTHSAKDEKYMRRCLELARKGLGLTRQNPLVGSVIVFNDRIIGEGYHHEFGGPHAEVLAMQSIADRSLLKKSTLYVNLEPCAHYGKTPPCSLAIKEAGIPRIVIGCKDSNPEVSGKGKDILLSGGAEVETGILEEECRFMNRRFFTFHEQKRPYVILKWAESKDGYTDKNRQENHSQKPEWITDHTARMLVHKWRSEEIAIMAGTDTLLLDNPELNVREWPGINPLRIVPDRKSRLTKDLKIMNGLSPTIIITGDNKKDHDHLKYIRISSEKFDVPDLLNELYKLGVLSVFVEGGTKFIQSFIKYDLWDEARVFKGNQMFISGVKAPELNLKSEDKIMVRGSELAILRKKSRN